MERPAGKGGRRNPDLSEVCDGNAEGCLAVVLGLEQVKAELVQRQEEFVPIVEENQLQRAFAAHGLGQQAISANSYASELTSTST